jgi:uncharacterized protein YkwD
MPNSPEWERRANKSMTATLGKVFFAGCAALTVLFCCTPSPAAGQGNSPHASPNALDALSRVISEVNQYRASAGCPAVRERASLNRAAEAHSADMAAHGRLTHVGTDGSGPGDRMRAAGYEPGHTGEVIAVGLAGATAVVREWMDSPAHRSILLTCRYTDAGAGAAAGPDGPWWTLDLAAPR